MSSTTARSKRSPQFDIAQEHFFRACVPAAFNRSTSEPFEREISVVTQVAPRSSRSITCREVVADHRSPDSVLVGLDRVRLCNIGTTVDPYHVAKRLIIHEDRITVFNEPLISGKRSDAQRSAEKHLSRGRYNGFISPATARILRKRLEGWINCIIHNAKECGERWRPRHSKLSFVTLTLPAPQMHSDQELRRGALDRFITDLRRSMLVQEYFWKAEAQENGNVHYHLLVDRFVAKDQLDRLWAKQMERLGYMDQFRARHGSKVPPMVNVKVCPANMSLVQYVMKYVTKRPIKIPSFAIVNGLRVKTSRHWAKSHDQFGEVVWKHCRPISGRVWGSSDGIKQVSVQREYMTYRNEDFLAIIDWLPWFRKDQREHVTIYYGNVSKELEAFCPILYADYVNHHLQTYAKLYPKDWHPPMRSRSRPFPVVGLARAA